MSIASVFQILGGLGVFLYGLRIMSQALQRVAGDRMRAILRGMTRNRFAGVVSGFSITAMIQSSSATTVLIVSFANAGLISLIQAIGLVMGANIGTTITGWLVALLGFKVKISSFALPLIGIAFPLSFLKSRRIKDTSDVFIGFGLLFLGLAFLKAGVPDLKSNPEALEFVRTYANSGFFSILAFVVVGTVVTVIVQSSSATMAITLAMAAKGWIGFEVAAAMVLGENIGTTITAQLAAIGANRTARRVAMSHTVFNLIGVLWMLPIMGLFLAGVDAIVPGDPYAVATGDEAGAAAYAAAVTAHLAAFHTAFNIINTSLMIGFATHIANLVTRMIKTIDAELGSAHLDLLDGGAPDTAELAAGQARRGLHTMVGVCREMGDAIGQVVGDPAASADGAIDRVTALETRLNAMEAEIIEYSGVLSRSALSDSVGADTSRYVEAASDIEEIGDHLSNLAALVGAERDAGDPLPDHARAALTRGLTQTETLLQALHDGLANGATPDTDRIGELSDAVLNLRSEERSRTSEAMRSGEIAVADGIRHLDMMASLQELAYRGRDVASSTSRLGQRAAA